MSSIPQTFIDELLGRVDIIEIIEVFVTLQKAGRDYKACCPFHQEKTPSFTVSQRKQFYYCFGCGANGNAIKFLMEHQHFGFVEAIEQLAARVGLTVPTTQKLTPAQTDSRNELYSLMEKVAQYYNFQLKKHPQKAIAIDYLRGRGLTGEICQQFGLGFAPPGFENLLRQFKNEQKNLVATGMLTEKAQGRHHDRFRYRIMFPIRDRQGRVIAFGGRVLDDATPKYLNSPETAIFHKSQELYGLYEATQKPGKLEKLLVVEGYLDVIALAQYDVDYAVATLGTALNVQHLRRLFRLVDNVIFCFDGDAAGQRAAWRALEQCLPIATDEREIKFLILPEKEDPDSFVRKAGKEGFEQALAHATSLTTFMLQHLLPQVDLSHLDGKAKLLKLAQPLLQQLPEGARKSLLWEQLTQTTGLNIREIKKLCEQPEEKGTKKINMAPIKLGNSLTIVQRLMSLLLQYPSLINQIPSPWRMEKETPDKDTVLLNELLILLRNNPNIHTGILLNIWSESEYIQYIASLAAWEHLLNTEQASKEVTEILARLKLQEAEQELQLLHKKVAQVGLAGLTNEEKNQLRTLTNKDSDLESKHQH